MTSLAVQNIKISQSRRLNSEKSTNLNSLSKYDKFNTFSNCAHSDLHRLNQNPIIALTWIVNGYQEFFCLELISQISVFIFNTNNHTLPQWNYPRTDYSRSKTNGENGISQLLGLHDKLCKIYTWNLIQDCHGNSSISYKKRNLFTSKLDLNLKKKLVNC
jgi:hypothetical protein